MIVRIITCPKCLNKTLLVTVTDSSISKKCSYSKCDFRESLLLDEFKKNKQKKEPV